MKLNKLMLPIAVGFSLATAVQCPAQVLQFFNLSIRTTTQGATNDNGTDTIFSAPKIESHKGTELLKRLAEDEALLGHWDSNSFPAGAKLASAGDEGLVVVLGTNILVGVSEVMFFDGGENEIISGKENDATGLREPSEKTLHIGKLTFDDTTVRSSGGLKFYLQGLVTSTKTDSKVVNGVYTETRTGTMSNAAGEGIDSEGRPFVCTGTITATGKAKRTL
jgi:hypothetical protein